MQINWHAVPVRGSRRDKERGPGATQGIQSLGRSRATRNFAADHEPTRAIGWELEGLGGGLNSKFNSALCALRSRIEHAIVIYRIDL